MNESKHTPGPWVGGEAISSNLGLPVVRSGERGGQLICNVNCVTDFTFGKQAGDDAFNREALANASLISAAPDLLAMLKHAVHWHDQITPADVARYEAAIAKAEGRS